MDWQQVLAIDAKYNAYRAPNHAGFKSLYLRRRTQLLQNRPKVDESQTSLKSYLHIRSNLLQSRYKVPLDQLSQKSVYQLGRTSSRATLETRSERSISRASIASHKPEVSRPSVSSSSIAENYAFSGMHHIFDQHKDSVTMVKFAYNDVTLLACSSLDGTISICHLDEKGPRVAFILKGHTAGVTGFDWSCSNDLLVSSGLDGQLCLWNASNGACLRSVLDPGKRQILSCAFHPLNSNWVVYGNTAGIVQSVNVSTGRLPSGGCSQLSGSIQALHFDAAGVLLFVGNNQGLITTLKFNMGSGQLRKSRRLIMTENASITSLCSRTLIRRNLRTTYVLVNATNNMIAIFRVIDNEGSLKLKRGFTIPHSSQQIRSVFSPIITSTQGSCVVSGSEDAQIWILDIERESNPVINKLQGHSSPVLSVSFSYDESFLASSDAHGLVIIWKRQLER